MNVHESGIRHAGTILLGPCISKVYNNRQNIVRVRGRIKALNKCIFLSLSKYNCFTSLFLFQLTLHLSVVLVRLKKYYTQFKHILIDNSINTNTDKYLLFTKLIVLYFAKSFLLFLVQQLNKVTIIDFSCIVITSCYFIYDPRTRPI